VRAAFIGVRVNISVVRANISGEHANISGTHVEFRERLTIFFEVLASISHAFVSFSHEHANIFEACGNIIDVHGNISEALGNDSRKDRAHLGCAGRNSHSRRAARPRRALKREADYRADDPLRKSHQTSQRSAAGRTIGASALHWNAC
jgi:hypothetical protein